MRIRVLLFAAHREMMGTGQILVEVPDGAAVEDVYRQLVAQSPGMQTLRQYTTFAVNREVVDAGTSLHAGDEVAFMQPMSGGSGD